ncbi:hypothetical protein [Ochrobactrum sp. Marseille-Q0166]|uniref:hypothetical protein n=1 Tax=Ochrobactrum sp. Marseille-Q0166 TaxID=2761105 RepID=UPI001654C518|nr:hypothetical protein [Ochrobactrum sp. Marseille-Q0166]MBC8719936.1 hypothetical protein [Ochrobactrum sp. Marseille-Q0166]
MPTPRKNNAGLPISRSGAPFGLLKLLSAELNEDDLHNIARLDYGRDAGKHLTGLRQIVDQSVVPSPLPWHPMEVLRLGRWHRPKPEASGETIIQVCWQQAFCCTVLLVVAGDSENDEGSNESTVIHLIESLEKSGLPADEEAADLLIWLLRAREDFDGAELAFLGLGLLYFALAVPAWQNSELIALMDWIMLQEGSTPSDCRVGADWLISGIEPQKIQMQWRDFGASLANRLSERHSSAVAENVRLISHMLVQNS